MPESPTRASRQRPVTVAPYHSQLRDWEGFVNTHTAAASYAANARDAAGQYSTPSIGVKTEVRREGSPSVAVLRPAEVAATRAVDRNAGGDPADAFRAVDHQTYLAYRRREFARRLEQENRGEEYKPRPFTDAFARSLPGAVGGTNPSSNPRDAKNPYGNPNLTTLDFAGQGRQILNPQVIGTPDEISWLHPPQIPPPLNWNEYWDLCPGHELLLQLMAINGVTPTNSPSLVKHFMYRDLLSCVQRMQYGTYLLHYQKGESPHERFFYVKSLPRANKGQYCPYLCWALHKNAHDAIDCIPLCNVMWVTTGVETPNLRKYQVGDDEHLYGPYVGKKRIQVLDYGALVVWLYDGRKLRAVELCATDPLVFTMWMKLLEDVAQLNAAVDTSGDVRSLQKQLEDLRVAGELDQAVSSKSSSSSGFLSSLFGPPRSDGRT